MALDMEQEIERRRRGWSGFARLLFFATAGVIVVLAGLATLL